MSKRNKPFITNLVVSDWAIINLVSELFENAYSLIGEAIILYKNKKYARAFTLSVFAEEEIDQVEYLLEKISGDEKAKDVSTLKNHIKKLEIGYRGYPLRGGSGNLKFMMTTTKHRLRLKSIFVDFDSEYNPSVPSAIVTRKIAKDQILHAVHYADDIQDAFENHIWDYKSRKKYFKYLKKRGERDGKISIISQKEEEEFLDIS